MTFRKMFIGVKVFFLIQIFRYCQKYEFLSLLVVVCSILDIFSTSSFFYPLYFSDAESHVLRASVRTFDLTHPRRHTSSVQMLHLYDE